MDASQWIDKEIADHPDWRGRTLAAIRRIVHEAAPGVIEEWKWMGTPVWGQNGNVCAADIHSNVIKMIFFKGASLPDPRGLFNAELAGTTRRAIKFFEGDRINQPALKQLIRAAAALNDVPKGRRPAKPGRKSGPRLRRRG